MSNSWSVKIKLISLCFFLLTVIVVTGSYTLFGIRSLATTLNNIGQVQLPSVRYMSLADMMHDGLRAVVYRSLYLADSKDEKKYAELTAEIKEMSESFKKNISDIDQLTLKKEIRQALEVAKPEIELYINSANEEVDLIVHYKKDVALEKLTQFETYFHHLEEKLGTLGDMIEKEAQVTKDEGKKLAASTQSKAFILIISCLLIGIFSSILLVRNLMKTLRISTGRLFTTVSHITQTSVEIASGSNELSQSVTQQASSLEETAASLEEISAMIARTSDSANTAASKSNDAQQMAEDGRQSVQKMMTSMNDISQSNDEILTQVRSSNDQMSQIVQVIKEIGEKTKVINDIVFQTKLLSFNASVEAARAGEHGKGFAVVAQEVGNLAQMSGNAAKEISEMLNGSISKVEAIVDDTKEKIESLIDSAKNKVAVGVETSKICADVLNEIVENVTRVSGLAKEISHASQEQAQGVGEINKAMSQLDQVTQQNTATSEKSAKAGEHLSQQAEELRMVVHKLLYAIEGKEIELSDESALSSSEEFSSSLTKKSNRDGYSNLKNAA